MQIKTFVFNPVQENTYLLIDDAGRDCIIIDAGCLFDDEKAAMAAYIDDNGLRPVRLINTHLHLDHCFGNRFIAERYGILPEACSADEPLLSIMGEHARLFGIPFSEEPQPLGGYLGDGDSIPFNGTEIKVLRIPGHSPGGLAFYIEREGVLFSGDSLFYESIGRTDLEGGDYLTLIAALQNLITTLPPSTIVYPGHGPETSIGHEEKNNPYV